ncbi:hypothetical protein ACQEVX_00570 [Streptomyces syringium]|uniref:hypothetical protein n=1 Tax=Streptomyces syringium TaxID=76729 RepID=UPI003D8BECC9
MKSLLRSHPRLVASSLRTTATALTCLAITATPTTAVAAPAYDDADRAVAIFSFVCSPKDRTKTWYEKYSAIEDRAPYALKDNTKTIAGEVRQSLYGTREFNPVTRRKMCKDPAAHAKAVSAVTTKLKGKPKPEYSDTAGLEKFAKQKLADFEKLNNDETQGKFGTKLWIMPDPK